MEAKITKKKNLFFIFKVVFIYKLKQLMYIVLALLLSVQIQLLKILFALDQVQWDTTENSLILSHIMFSEHKSILFGENRIIHHLSILSS